MSAIGAPGAPGAPGLVGPPGAPAATSRPLALEFAGVVVRLGGRAVLDGVDLHAAAGAPVGVAGPSGSGKSVLCLTAARVLQPAHGEVRVAGLSPSETPTVGLILQTHGLMSGLTAEENVALPLQTLRVGRREIAARATAALESVGLTSHADRSVDELSGGERQRVGIARALALDPVLLVADEPTAELDVGNRQRVLELLAGHAGKGRIVLVASDDSEVLAACRSVVQLDAGRVVGAATTAVATGRDSASGDG